MGMTQCCVASGDTNRNDEVELLQMSSQFRSIDNNKMDLNRIVNDASRRVREFKRNKQMDEEIESAGKDSDLDGFDKSVSGLVDLSSIGEALEWSPKNTPKKAKKKGFVRLSSYENQCFSTLAGGLKGQSPMSYSKSQRNVLDSAGKNKTGCPPLTPMKLQKSVSSKVHRSATTALDKKKSFGHNSDMNDDGKASARHGSTSRRFKGSCRQQQQQPVDVISFGRQSSNKGDDMNSVRSNRLAEKSNRATNVAKRSKRNLMRGLTDFTNEQVEQQGMLRSKTFR